MSTCGGCDPWVDAGEAKAEYGLSLVGLDEALTAQWDAVVLAVAHEEFVGLAPAVRAATSRVPGRGSWWTGGCSAVSAGTGSVHNSSWHDIRRNEGVNPLTAELLDPVSAREGDGSA